MFSRRVVESRKKKKKVLNTAKEVRGLSLKLWINGVELVPGQRCEFCETKLAVVHCPECDHNADGTGDFLCATCDIEVHRHTKREHHVRVVVPDVDGNGACDRIIRCFRHAVARADLVRNCRALIHRYYDPESRDYFYFNAINGETTWEKPLCLKDMELAPFPSFDDAAFRIETCWRQRQARQFLIKLIRRYYDKIFSREFTRFYYYFNGPSLLLPRVSWHKPHFLFWRDLRPYKNDDVAALLIQRQWLVFRSRQFVLQAIRSKFGAKKDPFTGRHIYTHNDTGKSSTRKPPLFGPKDEYDPEDMSLWDTYKLSIWFRRMGFKEDAKELFKFKIDGALLLSFEWQDFVALGITQSHQIKRILLDIEQRAFFADHHDLPVTLARRERLRYHHRVEEACIIIQRKYRRRFRRILTARLRETARLIYEREKLRRLREDGSLWWAAKMPQVRVPDHGKEFGNDRLFIGYQGRGHFRQGVTWESSSIPPPLPPEYRTVLPNNTMLASRGLHFKRNPAATKDRHHFMEKLATDSLTAMAARSRNEKPPSLVCVSMRPR